MTRRVICMAMSVALLGGLAAAAEGAAAPAAARPSSPASAAQKGDLLNSTVPAADHHKHLMGPAIVAIANGPPIAEPITLPAEIDRLLRAREAAWNDKAALAPLYTAKAVALADSRSGWVTGAGKVAELFSTRFGRPYSLTPVHFERQGGSAQVSGYYTRGEGPARRPVGYFLLSVVQGPGGRWLIAAEASRFPFPEGYQVKTAQQLVAEMDEAKVRRSVVLSEGFWADGPLLRVEDPYPVVMAENNWTAAQVRLYPDRLVAFCSFNPVAEHALRELDRCAADPTFRGLKFSFAMSGVDLKKPDHVARVRAVFARANARKLPIVVHLRGGPDYGAEHVGIFLREIMPAAPDVVVQVAHLWGGETYDGSALKAFADAVAAKAPGTRNLYFDLSEITAEVSQTSKVETQQELARLIRRIGTGRVLFGSDGQHPHRSWRSLVAFIPLSERELRRIAENVAPYLR